jgi:hypothetical protein
MRASEPPRIEEPDTTIYVEMWRDALKRLAEQTPAPDTPKVRRLLAHVERGWEYARELQLLYERQQDYAQRGETYAAQLLNFIDGFVIDAFRGLAFSAAAFVPGGSQPAPHRVDLSGATDTFAIYASMLYLGSGSGVDVPAELSSIVRPASAALVSWVREYRVQVARLLPRRRPRRRDG